jgi:hypothetical protein
VLEREHGGGREDRDLLAVEDRAHGRAHRDLGLAVADVAADEAVHGRGGGHVGGHVGDRLGLVGRLLVLEGLLELPLPRALPRERVAGAGLALGVEAQELPRHVAHRLADARLRLLPRAAAQAVDRRARALRARVLLDAVEALDGDLELVAGLVAEDHELAGSAPHLQGLEAEEAADAVLLVDDEVARPEVAEVREEAPQAPAPPPGVEVDLLGEDVPVGEDGRPASGSSKPRERTPTRARTREPSPTARPSSRRTSARRSARPVVPRSTTVVRAGPAGPSASRRTSPA